MSEKTLSTLIKIHKQQVDVLRREMGLLESEMQQLQTLTENLTSEHEREMKLVIDAPSFAGFFGAYSSSIKRKLKDISEEIKRLSDAVDEKKVAIMQEFGEQKKYEIAEGNLKQQIREEGKRNLQQRFDEVAAQKYIHSEDV